MKRGAIVARRVHGPDSSPKVRLTCNKSQLCVAQMKTIAGLRPHAHGALYVPSVIVVTHPLEFTQVPALVRPLPTQTPQKNKLPEK